MPRMLYLILSIVLILPAQVLHADSPVGNGPATEAATDLCNNTASRIIDTNRYTFDEKTEVIGRSKKWKVWQRKRRTVRFKYTFQTGDRGNYFAKDILPEIAMDDKVFVGFNGGHTYIYYDGDMINSVGTAPIYVRSILKEHEKLNGHVLVALTHLTQATKARLKELIQDFKSKSSRSCVMLTCTYLSKAMPEVDSRSTYNPIVLFNRFLRLKEENPDHVEIIVLGDSSISNYLDYIKQVAINRTVVAGAYATFLAPFAYMLLKVFLF